MKLLVLLLFVAKSLNVSILCSIAETKFKNITAYHHDEEHEFFNLGICVVVVQVISKLTEGKASHIPYRDSKLTRLLQSSLSGHGRVSVRLLLCLNLQT